MSDTEKQSFTMADKIFPPWDASTVRTLNTFQTRSGLHPFTCPRKHFTDEAMLLEATPNGWVCSGAPACGYTQQWAHDFMADQEGSWLPQGAPISSSPVPEDAEDGKAGREALRAELAAMVVGASGGYTLHPEEAGCDQCGIARRAADAILAAGWTPPLLKSASVAVAQIRAAVGEPSSRQHLVEVDDDGNEGDCIIECPGCVLDEVREVLSEVSR